MPLVKRPTKDQLREFVDLIARMTLPKGDTEDDAATLRALIRKARKLLNDHDESELEQLRVDNVHKEAAATVALDGDTRPLCAHCDCVIVKGWHGLCHDDDGHRFCSGVCRDAYEIHKRYGGPLSEIKYNLAPGVTIAFETAGEPPLPQSYALRCGGHWFHVTVGFGCAWATSAHFAEDPTTPPTHDHVTRFPTRAQAEEALRLAGCNDLTVVEPLTQPPNLDAIAAQSLEHQAALRRRLYGK